MTEQDFFDRLTEINKAQPFVYTEKGTIRQMNTNYCPITAVAKEFFPLPDKNAQELNFQWHLASSLLDLEYLFAREIVRASDYAFIDKTNSIMEKFWEKIGERNYQEQQRILDRLLAATNLSPRPDESL